MESSYGREIVLPPSLCTGFCRSDCVSINVSAKLPPSHGSGAFPHAEGHTHHCAHPTPHPSCSVSLSWSVPTNHSQDTLLPSCSPQSQLLHEYFADGKTFIFSFAFSLKYREFPSDLSVMNRRESFSPVHLNGAQLRGWKITEKL